MSQMPHLPVKKLKPNGLSRRRFLKLSSVAAGALTLGVPTLLKAKGTLTKLNVAHIGLGGMGRTRLTEMLGCNANVVALCDVDENQFAEAEKSLAKTAFKPAHYVDYRELLARPDLDAVVIATSDHWHAPIATAALQAGKHVFCEKPLTHSIDEARQLRELSRQSTGLVTQMGNQGSASGNLRRGIEIIQAGALGPIRAVYCWIFDPFGTTPGQPIPTVGDPVPAGMHWDAWLGPGPVRAYKNGCYHPWHWRAWLDFGSGVIGNFGCHNLNLPYRALKLDYPVRVESHGDLVGLPAYSGRNRMRFDFAARGELAPVTLWWYDCKLMPPAEVVPKTVVDHFGEMPKAGVLILGENGFTFGDAWNGSEYIQLKGEKNLSGIQHHAATKDIPISLPRSPGHLPEWVNACGGGPATFSNFETGGHLTEIVLSGVVALRTQKALDWNGPEMRATNAAEAQRFVRLPARTGWKI